MRRSTTSYILTLCDSCISWKSQLQSIVTLPSTLHIIATEVIKETMWSKGLIKALKLFKGEIIVFSNSQSAIFLC